MLDGGCPIEIPNLFSKDAEELLYLNLPFGIEIRVDQYYILDALPIFIELVVVFFSLIRNLSKEFIELAKTHTVLEKTHHHIKPMIPCEFLHETGADGRIVIVYQDLPLFGKLFDEFLALNSRSIFLIVQVC